MKLAYKKVDNVIHLPVEKIKSKPIEYFFQLILNLVGLYIANKITIDIWRSLTGH
jgi:hypothetical protein